MHDISDKIDTMSHTDNRIRCGWCTKDQLYMEYHDFEWGRPVHDDRHLFEMLCLEGAQAGLSWYTILKKRAHYQKVFDNFDAAKIARYTQKKREMLLSDPGIVRNKLKVNAFIVNAQLFQKMKNDGESFSEYLWSFTQGEVIDTPLKRMSDYPATTAESDAMSKDLKKRGFKFVGSTICYAFMQACGMVNDHMADCWLRTEGVL